MTPSVAGAVGRGATVAEILKAMCIDLTAELDAHGCNLSRVIGQLLVDLVEYAPDGRKLQLGRGYLIPDYPETQEVIERLEPKAVSLHDTDVDAAEAVLLRELDFDSLLMLPLVIGARCWGLVEIYRRGARTFDAADIARADEILAATTAAVEDHQRRAAAA